MTIRPSRRRTMQAALVTAAAVTLPRSRAAAQPATPAASGDATITAAQVQAAVDRLDALIEDGMTKTGVPGVAVAVVHNDTVVYERGFGVRELGRSEPITPDTVFQIASLSKSLSSTLVAALVGDGTTTWDARIGSIETDFALSDPWVSEQVTIRDMLCHRSGLPLTAVIPWSSNFTTIATSASAACATTHRRPLSVALGRTPISGSALAPTRQHGQRRSRGMTWPRRGCSHLWA